MTDTLTLVLMFVAVIAAVVLGYLIAEQRVTKKRDKEDEEFYSHFDPFLNAVDAWDTASVSTEDERVAADRAFKEAIIEWRKYEEAEEEPTSEPASQVDGAI